MIEKFDAFHDTQNGVDNQQLTHCFMSARALVKLNDLVDAVNALVEENNLKHDAIVKRIKELETTRKALDVAVDTLKNATEYLGNQEPLVDVMATNLHIDLSKALEQINEITKGGGNE